MSYSVIGGPAIGFDLCRLAGGDHVASVLRTGLAASSEDLRRLAERHPGLAVRAQWRRECEMVAADSTTLRESIPLMGAALDDAAGGDTTLLHRLEHSLLGDVHTLDRLVRRELLDWTWLHSGPVAVQDPEASAAADVLVDAAVSGFLRDLLSDGTRRAMAAPFLRASVPPRGAAVRTGMVPVDHVLAVVSAADEEVRSRWRHVTDQLRVHTAQWAPAMHQATWALSLPGRLREGCDAQLAGVIAFRAGGFTARDAAYGVWNALAGVLQACAGRDLLPEDDAEVLLRPWRTVYGVDPSLRP